jgi:integration host factor subunit beta
MNRSDLIDQLKEDAAINKKDAEAVINILFDTISDTLSLKDRVEIRGFGSFTVKHYKPYIGRNPKSGQKINVPSKKLPFFKVGKELKDKVDF